jgi:glycosyltransferase domain-containing protein
MKDNLMNITIVVPTKNRPQYVMRLLNYYLSINFSGHVAIIDSSDKEIAQYIEKFISQINKKNFSYTFTLGLPTSVIKENLNLINTKYASLIGDDDYLTPGGIFRAIEFLENNLDIDACRGEGIRIKDSRGSGIDKDGILKYRNFFNRIEKNASERVVRHFADYHTPFFHVCKSEIFIKAFAGAPTLIETEKGYDRLIGDELLVAGLIIAFGKFVSINGLHLVRTNSAESIELRNSWLSKENIDGKKMASQDFIKKISNAIFDKNIMTYEDAQNIAMNIQNNSVFTKNYNSNINNGFKTFLKPTLKFLYLLDFFISIRDKFFVISRKLSDRFFVKKTKRVKLKNLLSPNNLYHKDFIPVYMSIINSDLNDDISDLATK